MSVHDGSEVVAAGERRAATVDGAERPDLSRKPAGGDARGTPRRQPFALAPSRYVPALALAVLLVLPLLTNDVLVLDTMVNIFLFAWLGLAWNLIGGYGRQVSLGHAAYFGVGAYTSTLLLIDLHVSPWLGMLAGVVVAGALSFVLGWVCFRMTGPYFTIATIALAQVLMLLTLHFVDFTRGAQGLSVPYAESPLMYQFPAKQPYYYLALGFMLAAVYLTHRVERSRLGYYLVALGLDQHAAHAIGIDSARVKQTANLLSAVLAALAGTFFAQYSYFIEPGYVFGLNLSVQMALVAIVGGVATVWGPVLGAFLLISLTQATQVWLGGSFVGGVQFVVYALVLMAVVLWRPLGLIGPAGSLYRRLLARLPGAGRERG